MADRKRRGSDPADEPLDDEVFDDVVDDDAEDDEPVSRGGTATKSRARDKELAEPADEKARTKKDTTRVGLFGRIGRFFREVVAELRKVIWPSRKDLLTYASVVIVFVALMMTLVAVLDYAFARATLFVFGNP